MIFFPKSFQGSAGPTQRFPEKSFIPAGMNWHRATHDLTRIIWSENQFIAVGYNGSILTSPDGVVWTPRSPVTPYFLIGVAWSGSQYVAVGLSGTILTSSDEIHWTRQVSGTTEKLTGTAWSGRLFVLDSIIPFPY